MKLALVLAALPAAAWATASPEALKAAPFLGGLIPVESPVPALPPGAEPADPRDPPLDPAKPVEPVLTQPGLRGLAAPGSLITTVPLPQRLDFHRDTLTLRLGANDWMVSLAADASFKTQYFAFRRGDALVLQRIKDVNELRGDGIVCRVDANTSYRFKVNINIFSPVRGSTLKITPEPGTSGPSHQMKTGALLDAIKAKSVVFNTSGNEYWLLYGTDVDPATDRLANTRSLLIIHEAGMSSKAWPVAESSLPAGSAVDVALGDTHVVMVRGADGNLALHEAAGGAPSAR